MVQDYYKKLAEGYEKTIKKQQHTLLLAETIINLDDKILSNDRETISELTETSQFWHTQFTKAFNFLLKFQKANFFQKFMFVFFCKEIK